jgi:hypothetical protein
VPKIIGSFAGGDVTGERADPAAQARNCPLTRVTQIGLQLAERHDQEAAQTMIVRHSPGSRRITRHPGYAYDLRSLSS